MALANPVKQSSQLADANDNALIGAQQATIAELVDALDGATFTGDTLTTSATPTVDELEAAVGSLAGKVNKILQALAAHGLIADA
jgi:hypothetical protein